MRGANPTVVVGSPRRWTVAVSISPPSTIYTHLSTRRLEKPLQLWFLCESLCHVSVSSVLNAVTARCATEVIDARRALLDHLDDLDHLWYTALPGTFTSCFFNHPLLVPSFTTNASPGKGSPCARSSTSRSAGLARRMPIARGMLRQSNPVSNPRTKSGSSPLCFSALRTSQARFTRGRVASGPVIEATARSSSSWGRKESVL